MVTVVGELSTPGGTVRVALVPKMVSLIVPPVAGSVPSIICSSNAPTSLPSPPMASGMFGKLKRAAPR